MTEPQREKLSNVVRLMIHSFPSLYAKRFYQMPSCEGAKKEEVATLSDCDHLQGGTNSCLLLADAEWHQDVEEVLGVLEDHGVRPVVHTERNLVVRDDLEGVHHV